METRNITVPETAKYIEDLYRQKDPYLRALRKQSEEDMVPILLKETEDLLHQLLLLRQPKRILEIGTATGYGAICFAFWCPKACVTTIEFLPQMIAQAKENIAASGISDRISVRFGDARQILPLLAKEKEIISNPFDFIFIDAGKGHYLEFWELCLPLMAQNCVVVSDNVLFKGLTASQVFEAPGKKKRKHRTISRRLREYLSYLTQQEGLLTSVLPVGDGLAVTIVDNPGELPSPAKPQTNIMENKEHESN